MPDKEDVRKRLQQVMVEYDCNPTKLAGIYKVNQKTLNNHINGNVEVSVSTILLVLDAFLFPLIGSYGAKVICTCYLVALMIRKIQK